jgi:hypothetical protein
MVRWLVVEIEIFGRAAIAGNGFEHGVGCVDWRAAEPEQLGEHLAQRFAGRRFDAEAQMRGF